MADDPENRTIKLLQEMRNEIKTGFDSVNERFDDVNARIDVLTHIVTLLAANMGGHNDRLEKPEEAMATLEPEGSA